MTTELQVPLIRRVIDPISFVVPGVPVAWQRAGMRVVMKWIKGRKVPVPMAYTPDDLRAAEQSFLSASVLYRPPAPLSGPLRLDLVFALPIPSSWAKDMRAAAATGAALPTSRPDADNYAKLVMDSLNGVFWNDDAQIVDLRARKVYAVEPRTDVTITPILPGEAE